MGDFFYMFQSKGTILVVNDIIFLYICYYNHNGMNQFKIFCKSLVFAINKQNTFLCCHITPQELFDNFLPPLTRYTYIHTLFI